MDHFFPDVKRIRSFSAGTLHFYRPVPVLLYFTENNFCFYSKYYGPFYMECQEGCPEKSKKNARPRKGGAGRGC